MINGIKIEICIGNIADALKAAEFPIDRIELNRALELGGLSPDLETIRFLKEKITIPLCCMCRPRGGDFCYNDIEYAVMLREAENMLQAGADGIVFGFLNTDKTIDIDRTRQMSELIHSYGKEAVFHKAFDEIDDQEEAAAILIDYKIDRILTGGRSDARDILEGCKTIRKLNDLYHDRIQFLPGGGVRINNIRDVITISNTGQVHMTAKRQHPGAYLCLDEKQLEAMLGEIASLNQIA